MGAHRQLRRHDETMLPLSPKPLLFTISSFFLPKFEHLTHSRATIGIQSRSEPKGKGSKR